MWFLGKDEMLRAQGINITEQIQEIPLESKKEKILTENNISDKNKRKLYSHENTYPFLIFSFVNSSQTFLTELRGDLKK